MFPGGAGPGAEIGRRTAGAEILALIAIAVAAPMSSSLSWVRLEGAESCVAPSALAAEVEQRLGRPVFRSPTEADLAVEGRAERGDGVWRAVLRLTDRSGAVLGDRTVESRAASCDELGHVVAVTLALMIDPLAPPEPAVVAPRWGGEVHVALTGGYGLMPGATLGGSATGILRPPGFVPLLATGELEPFGRAEGADFSRATGGVQICPLVLDGAKLGMLGCVGVDAGAIFAITSTAPLDTTEWVLVQGRASLRPSWRVWGPLTVDAALHLVVPFRPVTFTSDGADVYTPAPAAVLLDVGAGLRF